MAADCYGNMSDRTMYVTHYNKEATECLKNVMGVSLFTHQLSLLCPGNILDFALTDS